MNKRLQQDCYQQPEAFCIQSSQLYCRAQQSYRTLCPTSTLTAQRTEMESVTYTLRLLAISSPEKSSAGWLGSATDATAQSTRREALANMRLFHNQSAPLNLANEKPTRREWGVPPWVAEHQAPFKLQVENVWDDFGCDSCGRQSFRAWQEPSTELMGLAVNPFKMSKGLRQCSLRWRQRAPCQERGS